MTLSAFLTALQQVKANYMTSRQGDRVEVVIGNHCTFTFVNDILVKVAGDY